MIASQLRIPDSERSLFGEPEVIARIDAAHKYAGLSLLLYCPSGNLTLDHAILRHCKKRGIATYLWYNVLFDNAILPEAGEQVVDAFGGTGPGDTGEWRTIHGNDELRFLACPSNPSYNRLVLNRARQLLADYDGLFVDSLGFALPSFGLEMQFSCFCPSCLKREPRLEEWRERILELRERLLSADDGEVERWGTFEGLAEDFGLRAFFDHRAALVTALAERYAGVAREAGKPFGIDIVAPALARLAGHDARRLAAFADWIKPRIYCHTHGPSSIPLECRSLAMGAQNWARRADAGTVMRFIGRSVGLEMPESMYSLDQTYLPAAAACGEIAKAVAAAGREKVLPGIECSLHPDFETRLREGTLRDCLEAAKGLPGVVLGWNLLFIPDAFLKLAGGKR